MRPFLWIALLAEASMKTGIRLLLPVLLLCSLGLGQANSPVPQIANPLVPSAVVPGGPAFTLTVNGTGFVSGSTVYWNGSARTTTFVSAAQLTATITASDVATDASGLVTVHSPGGTVSNTALLLVTTPVSAPWFGSTAIPQTIGTNYWALLAGDLNGDGLGDVAVSPGNTVEAVLGNGNGSFQYPVNYSLPSSTEVFGNILADFNNDGALDLVISSGNNTGNAVNVFLGNGDGTFQPAMPEFSGAGYNVAAAGDLNGDGKLDLVYGAQNAVGVLLGNGDGTFTALPQMSLPDGPADIVVGDFNRDGIPDIALSRFVQGGGNGFVSILLGNGDGTFGPRVDYSVGRSPYTMAAGDLNGDGYPDLTVIEAGYYNIFYVMMNNDDGTFQPPVEYNGPYPGDAFQIASLGDFNGDGKLDFATFDSEACIDGCLYLFNGNGDGTFQPALVFNHRLDRGGISGGEFAVGDFNLDGKLDLVSPGGTGPFVMVQSVAPEPTLDPGSVVFASQAVGSQSPTQYVWLLQPGNTAITINSISASSNFASDGACVGLVLNPGNTYCQTGVSFLPTTTGSLTGSLTINSSGGTQYVTLTGTGTPAINISISPSSLSFATQELNSTSLNLNVTLTNTGSQTLNLNSITLSGANRGDFLVTNLCGSTLAVGASCTVQVAFRPSATGLRTASLNIADNAANSPQTVPLSGTGTALHISTNLLQFGNVTVGSSSSQLLTLRNLGFRTISVGRIKIIGGNGNNYSQTNTCGSGIPPRSNCTFTVTFTPQRQGQLNAALSFSTNGSGTQAVSTVSLRGRGE
jgi:hypothetical protein